jgi:hypothetical protein
MVVKLNDPVNIIIIKIAELKINSYEIIAAVDLKEPKKAYLELADQPAKSIPYIPKEDKAKVYKIPKEKSEMAKPCPKGIIPQPNKLKIKVETGAK